MQSYSRSPNYKIRVKIISLGISNFYCCCCCYWRDVKPLTQRCTSLIVNRLLSYLSSTLTKLCILSMKFKVPQWQSTLPFLCNRFSTQTCIPKRILWTFSCLSFTPLRPLNCRFITLTRKTISKFLISNNWPTFRAISASRVRLKEYMSIQIKRSFCGEIDSWHLSNLTIKLPMLKYPFLYLFA